VDSGGFKDKFVNPYLQTAEIGSINYLPWLLALLMAVDTG
jgi:hypothetical protein